MRVLDTTELVVLLHRNIYSVENVNNLLISNLDEYFTRSIYQYDPIRRQITIYFKKSYFGMSREPGYKHDAAYYISYINMALYSFLTDMRNIIYNDIHTSGPNRDALRGIFEEIMASSDKMSVLYNVTTRIDNTIIIDL